MNNRKIYSTYFRPVSEEEAKNWRPAPKIDTSRLFEDFVNSSDQMVEVNVDALPRPRHKVSSRVRSTKQDSFASSFYSWRRKKKTQRLLEELGIDVLIIRRGERIALKKTKRKKK